MTTSGRSEELVSRCLECDLAEPESLASLGGSAPRLVDGILSMIPDSALKKKLQSIAYHSIHEGAVRDEWHMAYVSTHDNEADLLTKLLPSGEKCKGFV